MKFQSLIARLTAAVFSALLIAFVLVSCNEKNEVAEPSNGSADQTKAKIGHLLDLYDKVNATEADVKEYEAGFAALNADELKAFDSLDVQHAKEKALKNGQTLSKEELAVAYAYKSKQFNLAISTFGRSYNKLNKEEYYTLVDKLNAQGKGPSNHARLTADCAPWNPNTSAARIVPGTGSGTGYWDQIDGLYYFWGNTNDNDCDIIIHYSGVNTRVYGNSPRARGMLDELARANRGLGRKTSNFRIYTEIQIGNWLKFRYFYWDDDGCRNEVKMLP